MEFLKKELAPITAKAWEEIECRARCLLMNTLVGRKVVKVTQSKDKGCQGIFTGRMGLKQKDDLYYGIYRIQPLVETRISFVLNRWELDNIERGAKDINFDSLDQAVNKVVDFENSAIFNGLEEGCIEGLNSSTHTHLNFGNKADEIITNLMIGIGLLEKSLGKKPYVLVVSQDKWVQLNTLSEDALFIKKIEKLVGKEIVVLPNAVGAYLLPFDDDNFELITGMDYSIGYQDSDDVNVKLFITASFTFRISDKSQVVVFKN